MTDAYVTAPNYRLRTDKSDDSDDTVILEQLKAVSRLLDRECERFFTIDAAAVARYIDGRGGKEIWLNADIGSVSNLVVLVDLDNDGVPETTLTKDTDFWLLPRNAALGPEPRPWEAMLLMPTTTVLTAFPNQADALKITALWGWPAVPAAIVEATVLITRQLRDLQEAGITMTIQSIDEQVQQSPDSLRLLDKIRAMYRRGVMSF